MEQYQILESLHVIRGVAAQDAMNFFTIVSAYLVVAYLAGAKLSTFQVWSISILYSLFCFGPIMAVVISLQDMSTLPYAIEHSSWYNGVSWLPWVMVFAWGLSIVFMLNSRSTGKDDNARVS